MTKIEKLIEFLKNNKKTIKPVELKTFLEQVKIEENDLMPWADFEHPKHEGYGRKLVFEDSNFEVMVMSWVPNDFSAIHNHGFTQWGAVQVFGPASHYVFKKSELNIELVEKQTLKTNQILMVTNGLIHQMGNQTVNPYLTLHIYGSKNDIDVVTADSLIYELEKNRVVKTTGGAFFQLSENEVEFVSEINCSNENTLLEFATTILPKVKAYKPFQKEEIFAWLSQKRVKN